MGETFFLAEAQMAECYAPVADAGAALAQARAQLVAQVAEHATNGGGFLVLAHPPGTGKGFNTALGLRQWMQAVPTGDDGSGFLV